MSRRSKVRVPTVFDAVKIALLGLLGAAALAVVLSCFR